MRSSAALLVVIAVTLSACGGDDSSEPSAEPEPTAVKESSAVEIVPQGYGRATENRVRVRPEPGLDNEPVGHLYRGDPLEIYESTPDEETIGDMTARWFLVRTPPGLQGWAFGAFVEEIDEETYTAVFESLSAATVNVPWEEGTVDESTIRGGSWSVEPTVGAVDAEFFPQDVVAVGGEPFRLACTDDPDAAVTGVWRIRNGYLVTELQGALACGRLVYPAGYYLWRISSTEESLYTTRLLEPLYRDAPPLIDRSAPVPAGAERRVGNVIVEVTGRTDALLAREATIRARPDDEAAPLRFTVRTEGGGTTRRESLPESHRVRVVARFGDWYYVETRLGSGIDGPRAGWIDAGSLSLTPLSGRAILAGANRWG